MNEQKAITPGEWAKLTREQKKQIRIDRMLDTSGVEFATPEAALTYTERAKRLIDVYNVEEPDRVPVNVSMDVLPFYLAGKDYYTVLQEPKLAIEAANQFNARYSEILEFYYSPMLIPVNVFEMLDYKLYSWPGHGLSRKSSGFQFVEGEYMMADEYDDLILDPTDFWLRKFLPRVYGAFKPLEKLEPITDMVEILNMYCSDLANPGILKALQTMVEAGKELQKFFGVLSETMTKGAALGSPLVGRVFCKAPFDTIGDTLRGTKGVINDMYRQKDKLQEALEVITRLTIKSAIAKANRDMTLMAFFPLHKGADGWMSQKQFDTFYWPYLKRVIDALNNEGIVVGLFAEGAYNTRLEAVNQFEKGWVHWQFDQTDMKKAKEIVGSTCSISGNIPSSIMITGTPAEVKEYSRKLIETCAPGGGYMLGPGAVGTEEVKIDNIIAMVEAAREYGVYKK